MSEDHKQAWKDRGVGALIAFTVSMVLALLTIAPDRTMVAQHDKALPALRGDVESLKISQGKDEEHWKQIQDFMTKIDAKLEKIK